MNFQSRKSFALSVFISIAVSACGGGGGGSSGGGTSGGGNPVVNASPGGIWSGTNTATGLPVLGLVSENGLGHFLQQDGVQYFGNVTTSGNNVTANYTGVVPYGSSFVDGSLSGTGTITGTIVERSSLSLQTSFKTAAGNSSSGTMNLTFNPLYNLDSSLATIAGNWRDPDTLAVINVNSNGVVFAQDNVSGCVVNGQIGIINSNYNAYTVSYTYSSCRGFYSSLNATTATGLGALDNSVSPNVFIIGVTNNVARYSFIGRYPKI